MWLRPGRICSLATIMNGLLHSASLLKSPWTETFRQLVTAAEENLMVVSPFNKRSKTGEILAEFKRRGVENTVRVVVLTDLGSENALSGSTDDQRSQQRVFCKAFRSPLDSNSRRRVACRILKDSALLGAQYKDFLIRHARKDRR